MATCRQAQPLIDAGLESHIYLPTDTEYAWRNESYWCNNAKLNPACILHPRSASEVAKAIQALAQARQEFAVRAGGHMNWAGSNNINGGVTIDLGYLNWTQYDPDTQTARMGPGAQWKHVYAELERHGRTVVGAREGECGVGGFLLGGGNTFRTPSHGFACDNVVAYEVVLADGRIITADAEGEHKGVFFFSCPDKTQDQRLLTRNRPVPLSQGGWKQLRHRHLLQNGYHTQWSCLGGTGAATIGCCPGRCGRTG